MEATLLINKEAIYDRVNNELSMLRSLADMPRSIEPVLHPFNRTWFDGAFAEALGTALGELRRLTKSVEGEPVTETDGVWTVRYAATCAEQSLRLPAAVERYLVAVLIERWGLGRIEGINPTAAYGAWADLRHITLIGGEAYRTLHRI